jgi:uncharacterized RDD family membrane protein YckC
MERTENCSFCDAPLASPNVAKDQRLEPAARSASTPSPSNPHSHSTPSDVRPGSAGLNLEPSRANASPSAHESNPYPSVALEPAWREEVTRRLDAYRLRHGRPSRDDHQSGLPFASPSPRAEWDDPEPPQTQQTTPSARALAARAGASANAQSRAAANARARAAEENSEDASVEFFTHRNDRSVPRVATQVTTRVSAKLSARAVAAAARAISRATETSADAEDLAVIETPAPHIVSSPASSSSRKAAKNDRFEINIQPAFDFASRPDDRAHPQNAIVPVATLAERRIAGALDAAFLVATFAGFLFLFRSLVGHVELEKFSAVVYLAAFYLFYAQYFFLFTVFAGATPGMQLRELTIVRLDGTLPDTRQLMWRSFGYLLSAATGLLGFAWSLWDEDRFTWQDRISSTYITAAMPSASPTAFEVPVSRRTHSHHNFAHK